MTLSEAAKLAGLSEMHKRMALPGLVKLEIPEGKKWYYDYDSDTVKVSKDG